MTKGVLNSVVPEGQNLTTEELNNACITLMSQICPDGENEQEIIQKFEQLITQGVNPNCKSNINGAIDNTILHFAARVANKLLDFALKNNCDVTVQNQCGLTPLHEAVEWDNLPGVNILLAQGADVNCANIVGETPLHQILMLVHSAGNNRLEILKQLMLHNGNLFLENKDSSTPLDYLIFSYGYCSKDILEAVYQVFITQGYGEQVFKYLDSKAQNITSEYIDNIINMRKSFNNALALVGEEFEIHDEGQICGAQEDSMS